MVVIVPVSAEIANERLGQLRYNLRVLVVERSYVISNQTAVDAEMKTKGLGEMSWEDFSVLTYSENTKWNEIGLELRKRRNNPLSHQETENSPRKMASSQSPASPLLEIQLGSNQQCADLHQDDNRQPPCPFAATIQHWPLLPSAIDDYTRTPTEQLPHVMMAPIDLFEDQSATGRGRHTYSNPAPGEL
jgi:hypothetical protein